MAKRVLLVSGDFAESTILNQLGQELVKRGFAVTEHLGHGKEIADLTKDSVYMSDLVISSISENFRDEIQAGIWAAEHNIPFGLYAGGYSSHEMAVFASLRGTTHFLFHAHAPEAEAAGKYFPKTQVIVVGNPMWENFTSPTTTREGAREGLGIEANEKLIFVPGDKTLAINFPLFVSVIEAAHHQPLLGLWPHLVIGLHPGDHHPIETYQEVTVASQVPILFTTKTEMPSSQIIPGIDLLVTAMSSLGVEAAFQRKPVINFIPPLMMRQIRATRPNFRWEPLAVGAALAIRGDRDNSLRNLTEAMKRLLEPGGFDQMRTKQEQFYREVPPKGTAIRLMADFLEQWEPQ